MLAVTPRIQLPVARYGHGVQGAARHLFHTSVTKSREHLRFCGALGPSFQSRGRHPKLHVFVRAPSIHVALLRHRQRVPVPGSSIHNRLDARHILKDALALQRAEPGQGT